MPGGGSQRSTAVGGATRAKPTTPVGVQTLDRALNILTKIAGHGHQGLSLAECARLLGYSRASTHRILHALTQRRFLRYDADTERYTLGVMNLRLGMEFLDSLDLRREALPVLRALAETSQETVHLGVLEGGEIVYIEKVESPQAVRMVSRIGRTLPLHCSAIGKAIMSTMPPAEVEALLPAELERRTSATITDRAALAEELATIRTLGYSVDDIENEDGIRCVGAAISDHEGRVVAGLSISGPANRVTPTRAPDLGAYARSAAQEISELMGIPARETKVGS